VAGDPSNAASLLRRNALANIAGRAVTALIWVAVTPYVLGKLGAERFGVWSLFFVVAGYAAALDLGMGSAVMRFVARGVARADRGAVRWSVTRSLWVSGALGVVWGVACIACRSAFLEGFHVPPFWQEEVRSSLLVFAATLFVFSFTQVFQGVLVGLQRMDLSNVYLMVGVVAHAAVLIIGLARGWGLVGAAWAALLGQMLVGLLAARSASLVMRGLPEGGERRPGSLRELLSFGGMVQATNAFGVGQLQASKVMLGLLGQLIWVTRFELGFRVASALWAVPTLVQGALIPAATHAMTVGGEERLREVYQWSCRWVFALGGWVLAGLWVVAPALFTLWLGAGHYDAARIAQLLAVAFAAALLAGPATALVRGAGWPGLETGMFGAALALTVILSLGMVPRWGPEGGAAAMAVGYAVPGAGLVVILHRRIGVATGRWLLRMVAPRLLVPAAIAAAVGALTAGWPIGQRRQALLTLLGQGAIFTALHLALLWRTGDHRALLSRAWRRGSGARLGGEATAP
jgi:O-antigen/teichoic acid export membrane protein